MGRYMGQEIHKSGLILGTKLQGNDVVVELVNCDSFAMAILEMHLQMEYPDAAILTESNDTKYKKKNYDTVKIRFSKQEDALRFVLSH